jgi:hypothetical protein
MNKIIIKATLYIIILLSAAALGYYALVKNNLLSNPFESKKAYILETPLIVKEIKSIAELYSVCYFDQIVVDSLRKEVSNTDALLNYFGANSTTDTKLVLMASAKVYAGYNLSLLDSNDIVVNDSVLTITLPSPQIMDVVMNPSDVSTFIEEGTWSMEAVNMVKNKAIEIFRRRSLEKGILAEAEKKGTSSIQLFFKSLGFKDVFIKNKG